MEESPDSQRKKAEQLNGRLAMLGVIAARCPQ